MYGFKNAALLNIQFQTIIKPVSRSLSKPDILILHYNKNIPKFKSWHLQIIFYSLFRNPGVANLKFTSG